jgi:hypothetical protein
MGWLANLAITGPNRVAVAPAFAFLAVLHVNEAFAKL